MQLIDPANTPQPAMMMRTDRGLDCTTRPPVNALNQAFRHPESLPAGRGAEARHQSHRT